MDHGQRYERSIHHFLANFCTAVRRIFGLDNAAKQKQKEKQTRAYCFGYYCCCWHCLYVLEDEGAVEGLLGCEPYLKTRG